MTFKTKKHTALLIAVVVLFGAGAGLWAQRHRNGTAEDGVLKISENHYRLGRGFMHEQLSHLGGVLQSARAVPAVESGTFRGYRLQSIEPKSPFLQLGLQAGDTLTGINQMGFTAQGNTIQIFQQLQASRTIDLHLVRDGKPLAIRYDIP